MVIRIVLLIVFLLTGCSKKSDIRIEICNNTMQNKKIEVHWNDANKSVRLKNNQCQSIKVEPIKGESSISLKIGNVTHIIDTYFEPYGYNGTIYINVQANDTIIKKDTLTIK